MYTKLKWLVFLVWLPCALQASSLWSGKGGVSTSLYSDTVATSVGDLITIVVNLQTTATRDQSLDSSKTANINDSIKEPWPLSQLDIFRYLNMAPNMNSSVNRTYAGGGKISNREALTTTIQARVVDVLPNGTLSVEAKRFMEVGKEKSTLVLSGLVRPEDLDGSNSINSTKVADLQIKQEGVGPLSREQRKGWLLSFYEMLSPF